MHRDSVEAHWDAEATSCWLIESNGSFAGRLHVRNWWRPESRKPEVAWTIEWMNSAGDDPPLYVAPVEIPAMLATSDERRQQLVTLALTAKESGEPAVPPPAGSIDTREWRDIADGLDRLFAAWVDAEGSFRMAAARDDGPSVAWARWITLTDALNRLYAIDSSLKTLWDKLPPDLREDASVWSDLEAEKTIAHNRRILANFDPATASGWEAWRERQRTGKPYRHWSGPLMAGAFHPDFFTGLRWVRGQLTYHAVPEPIELRQLRPGDEPRWKWKSAGAVSTEAGNERPMYEKHFAGRDVLGQFGWLIDIFVDAQRMVGRLRMRYDLRRTANSR